MAGITLFNEGPTHKQLVESALSRKSEIGVEDLSKLPPLERQAAALHWYAYEIRRNGLTNLRGLGLLTLEIRSALAWVPSVAAQSTDALLTTLEEIEEEDIEGTALILSEMLDRLLVDAEGYFSWKLGSQGKRASREKKIVLALAVFGDLVFAGAFLFAYLTRETDGGAWLSHMQRCLPVAIFGNILYAILWLPSTKVGEWIMRRWFALALTGVGLHLTVILIRLAASGDVEGFYVNLRFFALGAVGVLIFRLALGGRRKVAVLDTSRVRSAEHMKAIEEARREEE